MAPNKDILSSIKEKGGFCKKYLKKQEKRDWKTLDELFEFQSSVWEILVANDSNVLNWQEHKLVYNCPFYLKNNLCKHNMALAAALKFVNIGSKKLTYGK